MDNVLFFSTYPFADYLLALPGVRETFLLNLSFSGTPFPTTSPLAWSLFTSHNFLILAESSVILYHE